MRVALAALFLLSVHVQDAREDAREIVRQSLSRDLVNWPLARNYTYVQKRTVQELDKRGPAHFQPGWPPI